METEINGEEKAFRVLTLHGRRKPAWALSSAHSSPSPCWKGHKKNSG